MSETYFYIVNSHVPATESAAEKIAKQAKPGAIIMLSNEEFEAYKKGIIKVNWFYPEKTS